MVERGQQAQQLCAVCCVRGRGRETEGQGTGPLGPYSTVCVCPQPISASNVDSYFHYETFIRYEIR